MNQFSINNGSHIDDNKTREYIQRNGQIIDVRSPAEFMGGHVVGAKNIPLNEIDLRLYEFEEMDGPFILCCASGNRSGQACEFLLTQGIDCVNGGGWMHLNGVIHNV